MVRKLDLKIALSKIRPHPSPNAYLEQYTITPEVAAELLYLAAYTHDDIADKTVADLGCGTGRLAIGAALMGAKETTGVDIDRAAISTASRNAERLHVTPITQWVTADITVLRGDFDTVLQNPPFGVQRRNADRRFLKTALEIGRNIYSLHKSTDNNRKQSGTNQKTKLYTDTPSRFLKKTIQRYGGEITAIYTLQMSIPHMFGFHRKPKHQFYVDLYIIDSQH
jgi:putative methylase